MSEPFIQYRATLDDYWRGIILFERNVASYKFALGKALLELRPAAGDLLKLEDLAGPFARNLCDHLRQADKQGTFRNSRFLDACRKANSEEITQQQLLDETVRRGFVNVIDAFHIVGRDEVPERFFLDERNTGGGIRITDAFSKLLENQQAMNFPARVPSIRLLERLHTRNEFLINSHHPLRETLMSQTGMAEAERKAFLNSFHGRACRRSFTSGSQERVVHRYDGIPDIPTGLRRYFAITLLELYDTMCSNR